MGNLLLRARYPTPPTTVAGGLGEANVPGLQRDDDAYVKDAFSRDGVPLYEIDTDQDEEGTGLFRPQCGRSVGQNDRFCRNCGARLDGEA